MIIRTTTLGDLPAVMDLYREAQARMMAAGNPQWPAGWPSEEKIREDIRRGNSYVLEAESDELGTGEGPSLVGVFAFVLGDEPTYAVIEDGAWPNDEPYGTLHRVASNGKARGVMQAAL
ncbi:MAG: GNAT family N-acetyltransferase, partial [Clostridia bacterium]|nr:GNAT family N-acetyltransferase [Clostridia bacterium]